jgi:hypothetical protein
MNRPMPKEQKEDNRRRQESSQGGGVQLDKKGKGDKRRIEGGPGSQEPGDEENRGKQPHR